MPKIYRDIIQGSSEWESARLGIPTSSSFSRIITPSGNRSKSWEPYLFELLGERLTGRSEEDFKSSWMERGTEMESEAVNWFSFQTDLETEKVGFVTNDSGTIGASPDRLVSDGALLEIKCPSAGVHVSYLLKKPVDHEHFVQTQGQLFVAQYDSNWVLSYHPALPKALVKVGRDDGFISKMEKLLNEFSQELETKAQEMIERGWLMPKSGYQFSAETDEAFERWNKTGVI